MSLILLLKANLLNSQKEANSEGNYTLIFQQLSDSISSVIDVHADALIYHTNNKERIPVEVICDLIQLSTGLQKPCPPAKAR